VKATYRNGFPREELKKLIMDDNPQFQPFLDSLENTLCEKY